MPIGILFWMLMILWLFLGGYANWGNHVYVGASLLLWVIIALLGWQVFGSILK